MTDLLLHIPSGYWLGFLITALLGFAIPEANAIANKQPGDTLSECIRSWLHTDTPGGGWTWLGVWVCLLGVVVWLGGHIAQVWP